MSINPKTFTVSADHVAPKYRLDAVTFAIDSRDHQGRIGCHPASLNNPIEFWAEYPAFGCGHSRETAAEAIRDLLSATGCVNIRIVEDAPVAPARKFIVTVKHNGEKWPLRGTVWAYSMDRAQKFDTRELAQAALTKAKQFMKVAIYKAAIIEEVDA